MALHFASVEPYEGMKAFVEKSTKDYIGLRQKASGGGFSESFMDCIPKPAAVNGAKGIPRDFKFCGVCGAKLG